MPRIANTYTIQQLIDNQTATTLEGDDRLTLIASMPLTANPNGWVTGSFAVNYSDIVFLENPQTVADTFTYWMNNAYSGVDGYDAAVDKMIFGIDEDGYLTVEPRPDLGFSFIQYNSLSGPGSNDVGVKDLGELLGILRSPSSNYTAWCPVRSDKVLNVFMDLQTGEYVSIYRATSTGDELIETVVMTGDGGNPDNVTFLNIIKGTLSSIGIDATTGVTYLDGVGPTPQFEPNNTTNECTIVKFKIKRNSDANSRFYVTIDGEVDQVDDLFSYPRPEQENYLILSLPGVSAPEPEEPPFIKFRNRAGNIDHRIEFIPANEESTIVTKDGEPLELGGDALNGYGICLSRDLCVDTGILLNLNFSQHLSTTPDDKIMLVDKKRGKLLGEITDLHLLSGVEEAFNRLVDLLTSVGLTVDSYFGEGDWSLSIRNLTGKNFTAELYLPINRVGDNPILSGDSGSVNFVTKQRDPSVYGANFSIAFCVAASAPPSVCQLVNTPWSNDITFDDVNLPNSAGNISVSVADATFGGWNVGVNLTANDTIIKFMNSVMNQFPPVGFEYRVSPTNPDAINIRYMGGYTGDPTLPDSPTLEPREYTFAKMDPGPTQDNRDQPWAQGTMAETKVCLANFFTDEPTIVNCYNTDTFIGE